MSDNFNDYVPAKKAAETIGIAYSLLMARIYKGKVKSKKRGWGVFIHKAEVAREKKAQKKWMKEKHADNKDMERSTG